MTVHDIMHTPVQTVLDTASIREAVDHLSIANVSGMPVVDKNGLLVGIITEHDIIKAILPTYGELFAAEPVAVNSTLMEVKVSEIRDRPVSEIMTRNVVTIDENASLLNTASLMIARRIKRLPVVRGRDVIGIVSRIDLVRAAMESTQLP